MRSILKTKTSFILFVMTIILFVGESGVLSAANKSDKLFKKINNEVPKRVEGDGSYARLVIRGGYVIDGTGAPPYGPADIVVENNRITQIKVVGFPGLPIEDKNRPKKGTREIDAHGKYILPGFIDSHSHIHNLQYGQKVTPEYIFKLWLGHGITTVREVYDGQGEDRTLALKKLSQSNAITAPRISVFPFFGAVKEPITTPEQARKRVKALKKKGADGIKFMGAKEDIMVAALQEAEKVGLDTTMHHAQLDVVHANVLDTSAMGLDCMEHWYGLPEALFEDKVIQNYPTDYIYNNEQDRFGQAGRLWKQAAKPGSERWNFVMDTLLERNFCLSPTFTIYLASRDLMRAYSAEWHYQYTMPNLWNFYRANRAAHGAYFFNWTTEDEVEWKNNFKLWMQFVNEYKNKGGRVVAGSDTGYIYSLYGFGYIQELELLQEAGFHPLEVIRAATKEGSKVLKMADDIGTLHVGKKADIIVVDENPIHNLKSLYGTGVPKLNDKTNKVERVGGIRWTINSLYGFGYIQELELLQEAGFHPLEVIRAATKEGSKVLKMA
ncbi:MAG: amidohydrolase family protein, partial [Kangiellaceae bacterium]